MPKHVIITPTYNDWKSLNKLLVKINNSIKNIKGTFNIFIINDCSDNKEKIKTANLKKINSIKIINLKKNIGSQGAIYLCLKYLHKIKFKSIITIMDSDGEDDPRHLKKIIKLSKENRKSIIAIKRKKRTESIFLRFLNHVRLIFTLILTGKYINYGNFSSFDSVILPKILINKNLSLAISAGIAKNYKNLKYYFAEKQPRYYGESKVNFFFLIKHSLNILTVFKAQLILRSLIFIFLLYFIESFISIFFIVLIILINFLVLIDFSNSQKSSYNLSLIKNIDSLKL